MDHQLAARRDISPPGVSLLHDTYESVDMVMKQSNGEVTELDLIYDNLKFLIRQEDEKYHMRHDGEKVEHEIRAGCRLICESRVENDLDLEASTKLEGPESSNLWSNESPVSAVGLEEEDRQLQMVWRHQMIQWSFDVVDQFRICRDIVAVAFSIFDRYVASDFYSSVAFTIEDFQLVSMTCLFLAVKILGSYPRKISIKALVTMSRGFYSAEDIMNTELDILGVLGWYVNPPTPLAFCRLFAKLLDLPGLETECRSMTELVLSEPLLIGEKSYHLGLAVLLCVAKRSSSPTKYANAASGVIKCVVDVKRSKDFKRVAHLVDQLDSLQTSF